MMSAKHHGTDDKLLKSLLIWKFFDASKFSHDKAFTVFNLLTGCRIKTFFPIGILVNSNASVFIEGSGMGLTVSKLKQEYISSKRLQDIVLLKHCKSSTNRQQKTGKTTQ